MAVSVKDVINYYLCISMSAFTCDLCILIITCVNLSVFVLNGCLNKTCVYRICTYFLLIINITLKLLYRNVITTVRSIVIISPDKMPIWWSTANNANGFCPLSLCPLVFMLKPRYCTLPPIWIYVPFLQRSAVVRMVLLI